MRRLASAWRALGSEQHLAALAAAGLFISMFLPWYTKSDTLVVSGAAHATRTGFSAWQAFSWVEAAVLLVSAGILWMLFARGEGRSFRLPGGDGTIVMVAGGWTAFLVFYRLLDKPGLQGNQRVTATVGVEWGIFITLLIALTLVYAGSRMRHAEGREPPLRRRGPRRSDAPEPGEGRGGRRARGWEADDSGWESPAGEPTVRRRARPAAAEPRPPRPAEDEPGRPRTAAPGAGEAATPAARRRRPAFAEPLPEPADPPLAPAAGRTRAPAAPPAPEDAPPAPAPRPRTRSPYPPAPAEQLSLEEERGGHGR